MFGFGKKNKMVKGVVGYTMHTIANMTRLDPTQLPDDLRDKILQYTLTKAEDVDDKYDFCANYMIAFALFLLREVKAMSKISDATTASS